MTISPSEDEPTDEDIELAKRVQGIVDRYTAHFIDPKALAGETYGVPHTNCPGCDQPLAGGPLMGLMASFRYGIAHGEGYCDRCGYPCRADHYIKDEEGKEVLSLRKFVLAYHPDELRNPKEGEDIVIEDV